ncbi:MAG TPA: formyltetrahydrofolate deformylase [Halomonas sp.]|jgi:formyltetrahydrofolate deformylase|uniref:formyltetrahydrofolate deformylase n=1 Tax=Halomonadaceae TaxID=28256 RepID=UPI0005CBBF62|nr:MULTISPECIES: formyltetrahydrofolate deformylase [Halomonas]KJD18433.1 formyltetrahydrofolate deformylase [Halomonas meridiana]MAG53099.1 formyltetrahydrofolate deformylase [Halomonas sp.]MCO7243964.1 formyltetrahydrofolate deformylase [Halomonas sp. Ps84H-12]PHR01224.1 MAG: formyltetrahydrofolate deformylase [Halomonas sp.]HAV44168.1 formyltetrahydrofolate deformylase [Halomonas sp.]|tara:strand:- start:317 stop:1183 length:867 start_codon:yes stop_codon:yes gene_type:complete
MKDSCDSYIIRVSCPATSGIISAVTSFLSEHDCYISELAQYDDEELQNFFLRAKFRFNEGVSGDIETLRDEFAAIAKDFEMEWQIYSSSKPMRVLLMVSKFDHCLSDLMYRQAQGELDMEITAIVSNHRDLRPMAEREGIRFVYLPVTKETKAKQEAALMDIVEETGTELVVLARYMQILSDNLCRQLSGRAINIHHSFLPGFKGAKPYHQAHTRGVKLIGATAHYVTSDLDEGPIIDQEVQRVNHTYRPEDLVAVGRNTETIALSRAVKYHLEHRIFLDQNKTVIFQ